MGTRNRNAGIVFVAGLALGYITSLFLPSDKRKSQKQALLSIKEKFPSGMLDELAVGLFGQSTQEMQTRLDDIITEFQKRFDDLRGSVESIDTKKYQKLVEDFSLEMQKNYDFSSDQVKQLKDFLESDYNAVAKPESKKWI